VRTATCHEREPVDLNKEKKTKGKRKKKKIIQSIKSRLGLVQPRTQLQSPELVQYMIRRNEIAGRGTPH